MPPPVDLVEVRSRAVHATGREDFYRQIAARGLVYGPAFQVLDELRRTDRDALATVCLPAQVAKELKHYQLHPALLDACFQSMAGAVPLEPDGSYSPYTYMPVAARRVVMHGDLAERMYTYAVRTSADNRPSPETVEGGRFPARRNGTRAGGAFRRAGAACGTDPGPRARGGRTAMALSR